MDVREHLIIIPIKNLYSNKTKYIRTFQNRSVCQDKDTSYAPYGSAYIQRMSNVPGKRKQVNIGDREINNLMILYNIRYLWKKKKLETLLDRIKYFSLKVNLIRYWSKCAIMTVVRTVMLPERFNSIIDINKQPELHIQALM